MNTLLSILLGFLIFIFISVTIVMMSGWVIMQVMYDNKKTASQEECGCKTCECDEPFIIEGYHNGMEVEDEIPMLDRPLTKKELKEMNMEEQNKEYNVMTGEDMMNMKTEVGQTASPENLNKSFRGKSYKGKHNRDYINFLDEQERKSKKDYHNEPLEENDPNINKK